MSCHAMSCDLAVLQDPEVGQPVVPAYENSIDILNQPAGGRDEKDGVLFIQAELDQTVSPSPDQSEFIELAVWQEPEVGQPAVPAYENSTDTPNEPAGERDEKGVGLFIRILAGWPVTMLLVIFLVMMGLILGIGPLGNVVLMGGWHARESHDSKVWDAFTWARGKARDYMSDGGSVKEDGKKMKPLSQELGRYRYARSMRVFVPGLNV